MTLTSHQIYYAKNKEKVKARARARSKKIKAELHDSYIIDLIRRNNPGADITPEAIEKRRQQIIAKRNGTWKHTPTAKAIARAQKRKEGRKRRLKREAEKKKREEVMRREGITEHQYRYRQNKEKIKAEQRARYRRTRSYQIQRKLRYKARMGDGYIKELLIARTSLKAEDIPRELIEAKRLQLQLKRLVREQKGENR